jgi:arabinofuranosyltransferase
VAAAAVFHAVGQPLTGIDDANIFLTYARNLARGDGFVYYAGGERVEGFTSFTWLLVCGACSSVTPHPEFLLLCVSVLLNAVAWTACLIFLEENVSPTLRDGTGRAVSFGVLACAFLWWVLASPGYVVWTTVTLMDTVLWSMSVVCGTLAVSRLAGEAGEARHRLLRVACAWLGLIALTRPESVFVVGTLVLGFWFFETSLTGTPISSLRTSAVLVAVPVACVGSLTLFRLWYFGYPLPNTFYAKVSPDLLYNLRQGAKYLLGFLRRHPSVLLSLGAALSVMASACFGRPLAHRSAASRIRSCRVAIVGWMCLAGLIPAVLTGGDHFAMYRHYQASWPLFAIPLLAVVGPWMTRLGNAIGRSRLWTRLPRCSMTLAMGTVAVVLLPVCWAGFVRARGGDMVIEFTIASGERARGGRLRQLAFPGRRLSLGVITAGGIAYAYDGPVIDLMGLNSVAMGHSAGDRKGVKNHSAFNRDVFFELSPDLLLIGASPTSWYRSVLQNVQLDPRFPERYRWVGIVPRSDGGTSADEEPLRLWCKAELLEGMRATADVIESEPD